MSENVSKLVPYVMPMSDMLSRIYPVGSIYMSVTSASPADLFGGTWERIKDRFLLASGDTYSAGSTGGEAQHTLSMNELPSHNFGSIPMIVPIGHGNWNNGDIHASSLGNASSSKPGVEQNGNGMTNGTQWSYEIDFPGGSQPHNNMPPYLTVYIWKRVA